MRTTSAPVLILFVGLALAGVASAAPLSGEEGGVYAADRSVGIDTRDHVPAETTHCAEVPGLTGQCVTLQETYAAATIHTGEQRVDWRDASCEKDGGKFVVSLEAIASCEPPQVSPTVAEPDLTFRVTLTPPALASPDASATSAAREPWVTSFGAFVAPAVSGEWTIAFVSIALTVGLAALLAKLAYAGVGVPLYSKLSRESLLDDPNRAALYIAIRDNPGMSIKEVSDRVGIGWGTSLHHLTKLEKRGFIVGKKFGKYKRYFVNGGTYSEVEQRAVAALKTPGTLDVLRSVTERPGLSQKEMAEILGVAPSTVLWHAKRLVDANLVLKERAGKEVRYFPAEAVVTREGPRPIGEFVDRMVA